MSADSRLARRLGPGRRVPGRRPAHPGTVLAVVPADCRFEHMAVNQRLRTLLDLGDVTIIASSPGSFPPDIAAHARIRGFLASARLSQSAVRILAFSIEAITWAVAQKLLRRRFRILYTFQDTSALAGLILRSPASRWVADVLDDPALEVRNAQQRRWRVKTAVLCVRDRLMRSILPRADLIVTIGTAGSNALPSLLSSRYAVAPGRIFPLPQAIAVPRISGAPGAIKDTHDHLIIFYVGWVSVLRGIDTLITAVDLLRTRGIPAELRLAGAIKRGDEKTKTAIDQRDYVTYLGSLPSASIREEVMNADVCCCPFPDREELDCVQPVKVLEFLALGRPIVASRTTGISALIEDGKSGILAIPGSSESFAAGIEAIFRDGALADRLSRGARDRAAQFDASYVSKQLRRRLEAWI